MTRPRIVVLGAGGLIGAAVVRRLSRDGEVLRVGRTPGAGIDVAVDLAAPDAALLRAIDRADALVHCAGVTDEAFAADPDGAWQRAVAGTARLADFLRLGEVGQVVYVSSAHVYGPLVGPIGERSAPDPRGDYAIAHFAAEQILRRTGLPGGVVRPCAVYGDPPDLARFARWSLTPFGFPRMAIEDGEIRLATAGNQRRNFVAVDGVADCVAALLAAPRGWRVVNPVGATTLAIREWADLVASRAARLTGRPCRVVVAERASAERAAPFTYLSERGDVDEDATLPAWTDAFLTRLLDARIHAPEQRRASA